MPGTFSPSSTSKETASCRSRHASWHVLDARAVMHVGIAKVRWRGKRPRYSRRMRSPQFYVPGKRPIATLYDYNPMREVAERIINWDAEDIKSILPIYDYPYMDTYQFIGQYDKWCRKRRFPLCNACIHRCPVNSTDTVWMIHWKCIPIGCVLHFISQIRIYISTRLHDRRILWLESLALKTILMLK